MFVCETVVWICFPANQINIKLNAILPFRFPANQSTIRVRPCENVAYADNEGPDQPMHSYSLIRTFTICL